MTKYRYQVLDGDIGLKCRELLQEIARSKEMLIYVGHVVSNMFRTFFGSVENLSE